MDDVTTEPGGAQQWLAALPRAVVVLDPEGRVVALNTAAADLFPDEADVLVGSDFADTVVTEGHRGGFAEVLELVLSGSTWAGELQVARGDVGRVVQVQLAPVLEGGRTTGAVLTVDALGPRAVESMHLSERLGRLAAVAADFQAARTLEELSESVTEHLANSAGATTASVSVLVDPGTLALVGIRGGPANARSRWATFPADTATPAGQAAVEGRTHLLVGRDAIRQAYPDLELAAPGERSLLCLPLSVGERIVGVVSLSFPGRRSMDASELDFYQLMADSCAQAVARIRAGEVLEQQNQRLTFLAEASTELASSLDYEATLRNVAWLAVPRLADWCAISLAQDGHLRTLAVAHKDPEKVALALELQERYPPDPEQDTGSYGVLRSGESLLIPEIPDEMLVAGAQDEEHLALIRRLALHSALSVPLKARGQVFGVITWVNGESGRRFGAGDLELGEDIARRAAIAIDNSQLHSELVKVADRLQDAVLPPKLPSPAGWELRSAYSSAGRVSVGGDFYDAIPLEDGRLVLAIGDVMGRGVEAAAAMTQVRAAMRAFVAVDPDPVTVLTRLDLLYEQFPSEQLVTLLYALVDPADDRAGLICAGHLPPLLLGDSGSATFVEAARGTLLGVQRCTRTATTIPFRPGRTLMMFTDGLVERRDEDLEESKARLLRTVLSMPSGDPDLDALVAAMRDPDRDDDVAVLAARRLS